MQHITCLLVVVDGREDGDGRLADNCFSFDALIFLNNMISVYISYTIL